MDRFRTLGLSGARRMAPWWLACGFLLLWLAAWPLLARAQDADCAEVKIVIEQKLAGTPGVRCAHGDSGNGMGCQRARQRQDRAHLPRPEPAWWPPPPIRTPWGRFSSSVSTSSRAWAPWMARAGIAPKSTADVHWLIIPSQGAGGNTASGRMYYVGAKVTHTLDGELPPWR